MTTHYPGSRDLEAQPDRSSFLARYRAASPQVVWTRLVADLATPVSAMRQLGEGTPTTLPRYLVDRVVTEFGVAHLRGRSAAQRADALAAIAHPDHRAALLAR